MTDRTLNTLSDLDDLSFDHRGLLPVVVQDAESGAVLMMAWANREALEKTLDTGYMHYWSRSRGRLWKKGETSGNLQRVRSLHADCDADTVLARVRMNGPACHTGEATCFGELDPLTGGHVLDELWGVIQARRATLPEGSYTTRLLGDENLRLKKLGEETVELVTALLRGEEKAPQEAADLMYHVMVALAGSGAQWEDVKQELRKRRG